MYPGSSLIPFYLSPMEGGTASNGTDRSNNNGLANTARVFVSGDLGVRFESLVLFSEPLFDLYGLDIQETLQLRDNPDHVDESAIAALEAARLFWAYFTLDTDKQRQQHRILSEFLLGPEYSQEDEEEFSVLFERMAEQWDMLSKEEREYAETAPIGFTDLLAHPVYSGTVEELDDDQDGYGPNNLTAMEAKAFFAQPLLNSIIDIDELDRTMERASAYWDLAHTSPAEREKLIPGIIRMFASGSAEKKEIEAELHRMLERFDSIFPNRPG